MIQPIVRDTVFLSRKSTLASQKDIGIGQDLIDTLQANKGACVGLATNMIGKSKCVIVILLGHLPLVMFNPKILFKSGSYLTEEGCLSLDGLHSTKRYKTLTVAYKDLDWQDKTLTLTDFSAQVCQHELDHLEGVLI